MRRHRAAATTVAAPLRRADLAATLADRRLAQRRLDRPATVRGLASRPRPLAPRCRCELGGAGRRPGPGSHAGVASWQVAGERRDLRHPSVCGAAGATQRSSGLRRAAAESAGAAGDDSASRRSESAELRSRLSPSTVRPVWSCGEVGTRSDSTPPSQRGPGSSARDPPAARSARRAVRRWHGADGRGRGDGVLARSRQRRLRWPRSRRAAGTSLAAGSPASDCAVDDGAAHRTSARARRRPRRRRGQRSAGRRAGRPAARRDRLERRRTLGRRATARHESGHRRLAAEQPLVEAPPAPRVWRRRARPPPKPVSQRRQPWRELARGDVRPSTAPIACAVTEIEIGRAKRGRRAYSFDDIAIVPVAAHPRPRGGQRRLADRRLPVRAADAGRADGLGDVAGDRDRVRPARRARGAQPRGALDPLRRPEPTCSTRSPACRAPTPPAGCRRSTPSRSSPS